MNRVAEVNRELKRLGVEERLRRGKGYYYFAGGDAAAWETSSVYTNRAELTSVDGWIREYERLSDKQISAPNGSENGDTPTAITGAIKTERKAE